MKIDEKFFTVPEVTELLKISRSKTYRLVQSGAIPQIKIGRNVRIKESDLLNWIDQNYVQMSLFVPQISVFHPP
jgi:excisionase family DNA binding protein